MNELFNGCSKTVTYSREVLNKDGRTTASKSESRDIEIKAGFDCHSRVTFREEGNQAPGQVSSDLVFQVVQMEHPRFRREGNNLVYTHQTILYDALTASPFSLVRLDG